MLAPFFSIVGFPMGNNKRFSQSLMPPSGTLNDENGI